MKVEHATPESFLTGFTLLHPIRLKVSETDILTEEAQRSVKQGVLEVSIIPEGGDDIIAG